MRVAIIGSGQTAKAHGLCILKQPNTEIEHEYVNRVWKVIFGGFEELIGFIKSHYNECRPHQSCDNKIPIEVKIAAKVVNMKHQGKWRSGILFQNYSWYVKNCNILVDTTSNLNNHLNVR